MCFEEEVEKMARPKKAAGTATPAKKEKAVEEKAVETTAPEKKAASKKPACKTSVCVEMSGLSVSVADIQTAVKKAVKEKGLEAAELRIYVNAAEQAAYYTVDGEGGEESKIDLKTL